MIASAPLLPPITLAVIAYGFLLAAGAKSAQVPFHNWLPGRWKRPTPISALIHAATMVNAGVYVLVRFDSAFVPVRWLERQPSSRSGVTSALLGGVLALVSTDLKRALAYSTISQLGFLFYAVGVGAIFASQFHLLSHALFKALLFSGRRRGHPRHRNARPGPTGRPRRAHAARSERVHYREPGPGRRAHRQRLLEQGPDPGGGPQQRSPLAFAAMLLAAGLTALYACRLVWRVFFGPPGPHQPARDASPAMRIALRASRGRHSGELARRSRPLRTLLAVGTALEPTGWAPLAAVLSTPTTGASLLAVVPGRGGVVVARPARAAVPVDSRRCEPRQAPTSVSSGWSARSPTRCWRPRASFGERKPVSSTGTSPPWWAAWPSS